MNSDGIKVRIFDLSKGLIEYEIEGSIDIKNEEIDLNYKDIKAFYMNSNNVFNLMIKEGN